MFFYEQVCYEQENIKIDNMNRQQVPPQKQVVVQQPQEQVPPQKQVVVQQPQEQVPPQEQVQLAPDEVSRDLLSIPMKKYYLIRKLLKLNTKLNYLRIKNDILSLVINFVDSFSYESLLIITKKITEDIIKDIQSNEK